MICDVQELMLKLLDVPLGQAIAETPSCALLSGGLTRKIRVLAWSVPVEPKSTSASPPPKIRLPGFCRAASILPRRLGVLPNWPVQRFVPNSSHDKPVMAMPPFRAIEIAGSLLPSGVTS